MAPLSPLKIPQEIRLIDVLSLRDRVPVFCYCIVNVDALLRTNELNKITAMITAQEVYFHIVLMKLQSWGSPRRLNVKTFIC